MIEHLESRTLMSASLNAGVLTVTGTDAADRISIRQRRGTVILDDNGALHTYAAADVRKVVIDGLLGNDLLRADRSDLPAVLSGHAGNDTLIGGLGDDVLAGGKGHDRLVGGPGNDQLFGQTGDDNVRGGAGRDLADFGESPTYTPDQIQQGILRHTLSPEQLHALGYADLTWQGQPTYAKSGEWVLGFDRPKRQRDYVPAGPNTPPDPALLTALQQTNLDIQFDHYAGNKYVALIHVPITVDYPTLHAALKTLPNFTYVEPNFVGTVAA
jgi:hypothetical protein